MCEFVRYDHCGRRTVCRERVLVAPAHYEYVTRRVEMCAGRWEAVERQEVVTPGHWEYQAERVLVDNGHHHHNRTALDVYARFGR
jgi:hypothetical protein